LTVNEGDVIRVTAVMNHDLEGTVQNVWWIKQLTSTCPDSTFMATMQARLTQSYGYIDEYMPDTLSFDEVRGFNVTQDVPLATVSWSGLTTGGVDVASPLPSVLSCLAFGRTGQNRVILKKYFGPFTEDNQTDCEWTSAILTGVANLMGSMLADWLSGPVGTATAGVYSKGQLTWFDIAETVVRSVIAYQRRRKKGRGQ